MNPNAPFLGCSPDGCVFENKTLIEIKCSVEGDTNNLASVLPKLKYLSKTNAGYSLREANSYYGQVQLNMLLLNLQQCDFIVYGKFSKCGYIINVKFNPKFAENLYNTLTSVYFKFYLPVLCDELK